jgi:hypothetical protein
MSAVETQLRTEPTDAWGRGADRATRRGTQVVVDRHEKGEFDELYQSTSPCWLSRCPRRRRRLLIRRGAEPPVRMHFTLDGIPFPS